MNPTPCGKPARAARRWPGHGIAPHLTRRRSLVASAQGPRSSDLSVLTLASRRRLPSGLAAPCRGSAASWGARAECPKSDEGHTATAEGRHQTASNCRLAEIDFLIKKTCFPTVLHTFYLFIYLLVICLNFRREFVQHTNN